MARGKVEEELTPEEFLALEAVPEGFRRAKINYEEVLEEIEGRCLSVSAIGKIMLAHSENKDKVYYSEVTGFLSRLPKRGWKVEKKAGGIVYYRVTKESIEEEESEE